MNKLAIAKAVIDTAAGIGVGKVTMDIIKNNTTVNSTADHVAVWVGSAVIGSMAAEKTSTHVTGKIDKIAESWKTRKQKNEITDEEIEEALDPEVVAV